MEKNFQKNTTRKQFEEFEKSDRSLREEEVLDFWEQNDIFAKTLAKDSPAGEFVFYEGPPTANGRPGIHHFEARAYKDAIPRYKTMRGYHVRRKGGWDTHGLPVELQVEKELGLTSKKEIEEYGIEAFNEKCRDSVWRYADEWQAFTDRIGYWVDMENPYVTYHNDYIESVWHVIGQAEKQGLLYKDYKVIPWCARCGTALSSHELAQGYEDVKDLSVTAKFELVDEPGTYLLAWTTTPWTLPGNVGLAVGEDIDYVKVVVDEKSDQLEAHNKKKGGSVLDNAHVISFNKVILAKGRLEDVMSGKVYDIEEEFKGKDLIGKRYKPLYSYLADIAPDSQAAAMEKAYQIYSADFVTTEDGTGIVHTAVMYGQEDFELGTAVGLPKVHTVDDTGHFVAGTEFLEGRFVKDEDVAIDIIKDLAHRGLLFSKEKYEHNYPHCWRCKTPLIYYARDSWYIRMSQLRDQLVSENEKINWTPEYIKDGRFGEWLRGIKDWAISRERYWGTPLPIWSRADGTGQVLIDSFAKMREYTKVSGNTYHVMRHAEAIHNVQNRYSSVVPGNDSLTEKGRAEAETAAKKLKEKGIDLIVCSPLLRTKETAEIVAQELGLGTEAVITDARLREMEFGKLEGQSVVEGDQYFGSSLEKKYTAGYPEGETAIDVRQRAGDCLYELEQNYEDKNILLVTHADLVWLLQAVAAGLNKEETLALRSVKKEVGEYIPTTSIVSLDFVPLPHNNNYEFDIHRPFIDEIELVDADGEVLVRTPEVMDVWLDSGCMPFAQDHYPFAEVVAGGKPSHYPADYISEGLDQTRGWFYTLHAVGMIMGQGLAYKNVISLGLLMDAEGKKMSKSRGNTVNPWEVIAKYGSDVTRYWMYSINQPGESKNFDEKTLVDVQRKVFTMIDNIYAFYALFADNSVVPKSDSGNILDQWVIAEYEAVVRDMTSDLDQFRIMEATRRLREFILDLSQWYVRRSRDRFKADNDDSQAAISTLSHVLRGVSQLLSPFAPLAAEELWQSLRTENDTESVHLTIWPQTGFSNQDLLDDMAQVRELISAALELRDQAGIKVRQPLQKLVIKSVKFKTDNTDDLLDLIRDELNVKSVIIDGDVKESMVLDTEITSELEMEGNMRELLRQIQSLRKIAGLSPDDHVSLHVETDTAGRDVIEKFETEIKETAGITEFIFGSVDAEESKVNDLLFKLAIK